MVKRLGVIFIALLYTITVTGFALNLHYCGDRVAAVKINSPAKSCVTKSAMGKMNCCKDAHLHVKVKDGHQSGSSFVLGKIYAFNLPRFAADHYLLSSVSVFIPNSFERGPPNIPVNSQTVFIKNRVFKI